MYYWAVENPYWMRTVSFQRSWSVSSVGSWEIILWDHIFWRIFK